MALALHVTSASGNTVKCAVNPGTSGGSVIKFSDGKNSRCIAVVAPESAKQPMPVLFWFHGSGGNAAHCGPRELVDLAAAKGFALVCGEAIQGDHGGLWQIPEIITDTTGTPCSASDSPDINYMNNAIAQLAKQGGKFDTSRIFTSGCSMGSAFSIYISSCLKASKPDSISAFATHSTGWKVKGDGNRFPPDSYTPGYTWGECPKCKYFPLKPKAFKDKLGLKACIFDNTGDPTSSSPFFYRSSQALEKEWKSLGMKTESHYASGGHCQNIPYETIVNCLDDGTKRLVPSGVSPSPGPSPGPHPGPSPAPSPGGGPPAKCQTCFETSCPNMHGTASDACRKCAQGSMGKCAGSCVPYPFQKALSWFCDKEEELLV
mmetsp:Transcript_42686/g.123488  ORF Transcript_42686/g.123488 Transcript_42686/m.123488 type:complete len:375 (+) Transcript_42686:3-1127(+)